MKFTTKNDTVRKRSLVRAVPAVAAVFLASAVCVQAAEYYVSPGGSDNASGSVSNPWRTVSWAVSKAHAGDTVYFRAGVWNERLVVSRSGTAGNPITFRNYPGEVPVLDGSGVSFSYDAGMVDIENNRHHIVIDGFEVRNLTASTTNKVPVGVRISGYTGTSPSNISILNCNVHSIKNTNSSSGANAHGIIVRGESTSTIRNIVISGNKVHNCILGQSEALVVNGNVDGFEVTNNEVYNNNNIGIDIIGYEGGISPSLDYARNGVVADNLVYNCSSINNPTYNEYSAGGIYVDGGAHILVERNRVYGCDIGIELASEHPNRSTNNVTVRSNILWRNNIGGIMTGGYANGLGSADNCSITNNTLYENDVQGDWSGEILIRYETNNLTVKNNIIVARRNGDGYGVFIQKNTQSTSNIVIDYNTYYLAAGQSKSFWQWKTGGGGGYQNGYGSWKSASGQDAHSTWGLPAFNNTSGPVSSYDFSFSAGALPQDKGDPSYAAAPGETDISGNPRILGTQVDTGAYEVGVPLTALESWRDTFFGVTANTGNAADLFDADKDGVVNLIEFSVTGGHPLQPDPHAGGGALQVVRQSNGNRVVTFPRVAEASELVTYSVGGQGGLSGIWTPLATRPAGGSWTAVSGVTVNDSGGVVTVTDTRSVGTEYFYTLSVSN